LRINKRDSDEILSEGGCVVDETVHVDRLENLKGRDHLRDRIINGRKIINWILKKQRVKMWTGFIWLRTRTNGGLL